MLLLLTPARGADQQLGLSVPRREIVRLAKPPANGRVYDLAFSPRGDSLVCAFSLEQAVQLWDVTAKPRMIAKRVAQSPDLTNFPLDVARRILAGTPRPVTFSRDGSRLAMGNQFSGCQIWDLVRLKCSSVATPFWDPQAIRFSARDNGLIIGCSYRGAYEIDGRFPSKLEMLSKAELERSHDDPDSREMNRGHFSWPKPGADPPVMTNVYCLAVCPDGKRLIAGGGPVFEAITRDVESEPSVSVWDIDKGRQIFQIGTKALPILRFCLSPDGRTLYSCGDKVRAWNAAKAGPPIHGFDAHGRPMISVAISPDGNMLAAGGRDGTVVIWHTEPGARVGTLAHDAGPVYGLAFSPTSTKLVAAGERGVATVWTVELHSAKKE